MCRIRRTYIPDRYVEWWMEKSDNITRLVRIGTMLNRK